MKFGIDYDGTITNDVPMWIDIMHRMHAAGHKMWIVTMRYPSECFGPLGYMDVNVVHACKLLDVPVICTGRLAKDKYMRESHGVDIHVWIDDNPKAVYMDGSAIWGEASVEGAIVDPQHED